MLNLQSVMEDVSLAVQDWKPTRAKLLQVIAELTKTSCGLSIQAELEQATEFLNWMAKDNFTLLGYREYRIKAVEGDYKIEGVNDSALGLMRRSTSRDLMLSDLPEQARKQALSSSLLILTKTNNKSRGYIVRLISTMSVLNVLMTKGHVIGEDRFIGLYSSSVVQQQCRRYSIAEKQVGQSDGQLWFCSVGTHAYKALLNILETYPRDELIQATTA